MEEGLPEMETEISKLCDESADNWEYKFPYTIFASPGTTSYRTYIVMMGATASRFATRIPISAMATVRNRARVGSPFLDAREKKLRKGMRLSREMA